MSLFFFWKDKSIPHQTGILRAQAWEKQWRDYDIYLFILISNNWFVF